MHATVVIESFIDDTVRLLPRRQRSDVASELRSLLNEELHARAEKSGGAADTSVALSLVRDYGQPNEVAARYHTPWAIIDPADSTSFLRAAIIGACAIILMTALSRVRPWLPASAEQGLLIWFGMLVVVFGVKNWIRQRWPAKAIWKPRDRDRVNRVGTAALVPFAAFVIVLYAAPAWMLGMILGDRFDLSWAAYTPEFQSWRLPLFIGLMISNIGLVALVAILGRWSPLTRNIGYAINVAIACLVLQFAVEGNVFQSVRVDEIARDVLASIAIGYVPLMGYILYTEFGRLPRAATTQLAQSLHAAPKSH